ncbi:tyrosine-type recombinase/integrase [Leuconostoc pseudomesenteroides]|uniref:tyrosine-type recombinase/integrase n=1 Tax=Leuconostoc pseudomesenteroides TaxID=33968 RepID=UPI0039ED7C27
MASFEKRGKKWRAVVSVTDGKGIRKKISKTFDTKKLATVWSIEKENKANTGYNILDSKMIFSEYYANWVETYKRPIIRESTYIRYKSWINNVKNLFGDVRLDQLTNYQIQQIINNFGQTHTLKSTQGFLVSVRSSLKDALLDGYIDKDIFSRVKANSHVEKPKSENFLSAEEFERLQDFLYDNQKEVINNPKILMVLIALETGARLGEICALRVNDIHTNQLLIDESYSATSHQYTKPKTKSSIRAISIPSKLETVIRYYIKKTSKNDILFAPQHRANISRGVSAILKHAGVHQIRFHGLRHSHVSYLLHRGVDISYISKRVGHSNTTITLQVYAHLLKEKEQAQDALVLEILS